MIRAGRLSVLRLPWHEKPVLHAGEPKAAEEAVAAWTQTQNQGSGPVPQPNPHLQSPVQVKPW